MTSQYLQALLFTVIVIVSGFTSDTECPKYVPGQMRCEKNLRTLSVQSGDSVILNCTCFNKTNGQWIGPNKLLSTNTTAADFIPYTQGIVLNSKLNQSKYKVFGGYGIKQCNLKITHFLSEDDGTYMCQYIHVSTVYIHIYNIVATSKEYFVDVSTENQIGKSTKAKLSTSETKHNKLKSTSSYIYCWVVMGSLVGVLVLCLIISHLYCCSKRDTKLRVELSTEVQYDDIGTINYNNFIVDPLIVVSDGNEEHPSIISDNNNGSFRDDTENSDESSFIQSDLTQSGVDYENSYQQLNLENIEVHPYSTLMSNNYENTTISSPSTGKQPKECRIREDSPWLVIYVNRIRC